MQKESKLYFLLDKILHEIEIRLREKLNVEELASDFFISQAHLQRLFKGAFGTPIANYIRSRRLTASLTMLNDSSLGIIDIALEYGFEHAQSYIRAFKSEFGITPGSFRKNRQILSVKPPLQLFTKNDCGDGLFFGPEIVFVPEFYCLGRSHLISKDENFRVPVKAAQEFWLQDKATLSDIKNPGVYIGLTKILSDNQNKGDTLYFPSIQVKSSATVPKGFVKNRIPGNYYARFHYIGEHHPIDFNTEVAKRMYQEIARFQENPEEKYGIHHKTLNNQQAGGIYFEKIDGNDYDGTYCKMEWFSPIYEK
jgi:AraC family transcriptional regulator